LFHLEQQNLEKMTKNMRIMACLDYEKSGSQVKKCLFAN
jgi:hypothetical protein